MKKQNCPEAALWTFLLSPRSYGPMQSLQVWQWCSWGNGYRWHGKYLSQTATERHQGVCKETETGSRTAQEASVRGPVTCWSHCQKLLMAEVCLLGGLKRSSGGFVQPLSPILSPWPCTCIQNSTQLSFQLSLIMGKMKNRPWRIDDLVKWMLAKMIRSARRLIGHLPADVMLIHFTFQIKSCISRYVRVLLRSEDRLWLCLRFKTIPLNLYL